MLLLCRKIRQSFLFVLQACKKNLIEIFDKNKMFNGWHLAQSSNSFYAVSPKFLRSIVIFNDGAGRGT